MIRVIAFIFTGMGAFVYIIIFGLLTAACMAFVEGYEGKLARLRLLDNIKNIPFG